MVGVVTDTETKGESVWVVSITKSRHATLWIGEGIP